MSQPHPRANDIWRDVKRGRYVRVIKVTERDVTIRRVEQLPGPFGGWSTPRFAPTRETSIHRLTKQFSFAAHLEPPPPPGAVQHVPKLI